MKKKIVSCLLAGMMAVSLAACGGGTGSTQEEEKDSASGDKAEIELYSWFSTGEQETCNAVLEQFEAEHPEIDVKVNYIAYDDYVSKLNTMISAGETPDIFYVPETLAKEWGSKGIAMDLAPMYEEAGINEEELYVESALFKTGENLWAVAPNMATVVMYYNKDLFKEAGITPPSADASDPWTWEEYVDAAVKLTKDVNGKNPGQEGFDYNSVVTYGTLMTSSTSWITLSPLLYTNGTSFISEDGKSLEITSDNAVEVLQSVADLSAVDQCAPTIGMSKGLQSSSAMLMNGQLGMFIEGSYIYPEFKNENYDVGVTAVPIFNEPSGMAWSSAYMMSKDTECPEEAFELFQVLTDYNYQVEAANKKGVSVSNLPNLVESYQDEEVIAEWSKNYDPDFAELVGGLLTGVSRQGENMSVKNFTDIVDQTIMPQLDKLWLGELSAEEAVQGLDEKCQDYLQGVW